MSEILIITNYDVGLYKFRKEVLESLVERYKVTVVVPKGEYATDIQNIGCNIIHVDLDRHGKNMFAEINLLRRYRQIILNIKPDVVLSYTIKPNLYTGLITRQLRIPFLPNVTGLGTVMEKETLFKKIIVQIYKFAFKNANTIFFQNSVNLEVLKELEIIDKNAKLLPGSGVNLEDYEVLDYPIADEINFVYIGRVMEDKGIDEYLYAAEYIKERYENIKFHIFGFIDDPGYVEVIHDFNARGIINYHGNVDSVLPVFKKTSCIVHPSYHEGMSNVLLEAAASGRPAIASNIPGCREIVNHNESGYLFEKKNKLELVAMIERFISLTNEERLIMGLKARKHVEENFDRQIIVEKYLEEISKVKLEEK